jgi:hypothetical protein
MAENRTQHVASEAVNIGLNALPETSSMPETPALDGDKCFSRLE